MIEKIIEASMRDKFQVFVFVALVVTAGVWALKTTPLDAIPDLSDVQVIVFTEFPGQAPQVVEDQVTYPLTTAMLAVPNAKVVRGYSFFGFSFVYIIFEDGRALACWSISITSTHVCLAAFRPRSDPMPPGSAGSTSTHWSIERDVTTSRSFDRSRTGT